MSAPLTLPLGVTENSVRVHPVVLFTVCDAYIRRNDGQDRIIGTLLGTIADGVVDVKNCYAVPHSEANDQVAVDVQHQQTMAQLHQKVNPSERVVGWFSTGSDVSGSDALIHAFYAQECTNPVHLTVDTQMRGGKMGIRAYVSRMLSIQGRELAREFQEVQCEVKTVEAERLGVDLLQSEEVDKIPDEMESLVASFDRLEASLAQAQDYVGAVVAGKRKGSVAVGRYLAETIASVPHFGQEEFERLMEDNMNDVLLVMYLSNLIRAHIALADKLGTMQLPLL